jgi:hypothetical protein
MGWYPDDNSRDRKRKDVLLIRFSLFLSAQLVTYHAINGNFGLQRTFVPWEPRRMDGSRGVIVDEEHPWLYFFDPSVVEQVKLELNKRES